MRLGIDASNLRAGGGRTHLRELLYAATPHDYGIDEVKVWGSADTLKFLEPKTWLKLVHEPVLDKNLFYRQYWQKYTLPKLIKDNSDLLLAPGGNVPSDISNFVTMCRSMLPFENREANRYNFNLKRIKFFLLRRAQISTFKKAKGIIFLTEYAKSIVMSQIKDIKAIKTVIPHGVNQIFKREPRSSRAAYSFSSPFKVVYVSTIDLYKHQWNVVKAISLLRQQRVPVVLELIGSAYPPAEKRLLQTIASEDPQGQFIKYYGSIPYAKIPQYYHNADLGIFASSCENMPNALLEMMISGLPIACSNKGPMIEILGDSSVYFNPEKPLEIVYALKKLIDSPDIRAEKADAVYEKAQAYTWENCARDTFAFIGRIAANHTN